MLKIKPVLIGAIVTLVIFLLLNSLFSLVSIGIGIFEDGVYFIASLVILSMSVFIGSLVSARVVGEKAMLYGLINFIISLSLFIVFGVSVFKLNFESLLMRSLLMLVSSVIGAVCSVVKGAKSQYL